MATFAFTVVGIPSPYPFWLTSAPQADTPQPVASAFEEASGDRARRDHLPRGPRSERAC